MDTLTRAKKLQRDAVEEIVNESFPLITRMAYALTGRDDAGSSIVKHIVHRGLKALPKFRDDGEPQRWFLHHTILATRADKRRPGGEEDLLIETAPQRTPQYFAFVRALRALPPQQIEAFVLHFGESFNLRYLGIAMDCSVKAAEQHLSAATTAMRAIAGNSFDELTGQMRQAYQSLSPAGMVQVPKVSAIVRAHVWPRRIWRVMKFIFSLAIIAAVVWVCVKILPRIEY